VSEVPLFYLKQVVKGAVRQSTSLTPASLHQVRDPDPPATQRRAITSTLASLADLGCLADFAAVRLRRDGRARRGPSE